MKVHERFLSNMQRLPGVNEDELRAAWTISSQLAGGQHTPADQPVPRPAFLDRTAASRAEQFTHAEELRARIWLGQIAAQAAFDGRRHESATPTSPAPYGAAGGPRRPAAVRQVRPDDLRSYRQYTEQLTFTPVGTKGNPTFKPIADTDERFTNFSREELKPDTTPASKATKAATFEVQRHRRERRPGKLRRTLGRIAFLGLATVGMLAAMAEPVIASR